MKLAAYLSERQIKRIDFAKQIGVSPGWVTCLCDGTGWPSREVIRAIHDATQGEVTANDFAASERAAS